MSLSAPSSHPAPGDARALLAEAVAHHRAGRLAEAGALYAQVLAADPANADALNLSGLVALARGEAKVAERLIARAVKQAPRSPLFHLNLGSAQAAAGAAEKAAASFERALRLKPDLAEAWNALGMLRAGRGQNRKAAHALRKAVAAAPGSAEAWNNLGLVLARLGETEDARAALTRAVGIRPDFAVAHNSLGVLAREDGDPAASIAHLERALALAPDYFEAQSNLGVSLTDAGRFEDAARRLEAALALKPDHAETHAETWRAFAKPLAALGRMAEARDACAKARALAPGDRRVAWEAALLALAAGDFAAGWADYRARPMVDRRRHPVPGAPFPADLSGRALILEGEQGLGEELFFLRFAAALKARGARLTARVDARLVPLVARMAFMDEAVARDGPPPKGEVHLLGDLPWRAGAEGAVPPAPLPAPEAPRVAIRARLEAAGPPPYLALTWRAGLEGRGRLYKEAPVDLLARAAKGTNATLIALQRAPKPGEVAGLAQVFGRDVHDFTDLNDDLDGMLALMHEIDSYAGVSNTNIHLAAAARAAGARVSAHVLVPCPAEFRWLADGPASPWFPGFTLHRETAREGWTSAAASLARALAAPGPAR